MKKTILYLIAICLISFGSFGKVTEINCSFNLSGISYNNVSSNTGLWKHIKFNLKFKTLSKLEWRIDDISIPNNLEENFLKGIDLELNIFKKLLEGKKLNKDEEYYLPFVAEYLGVSIQELKNEIKQLPRKEKNKLINDYEQLIKENLPIFGDFFSQPEIYLGEIKSILNIPGDVSSNQNMVYLSTVLDSGVMIKKEINYSKVMNSNSKNAIQLKFVLIDGMTINFDSECINESNSSFDNNSIDDKNTIESKLKKLKSLFDQNLITQEEYDAKRKEILDAM